MECLTIRIRAFFRASSPAALGSVCGLLAWLILLCAQFLPFLVLSLTMPHPSNSPPTEAELLDTDPTYPLLPFLVWQTVLCTAAGALTGWVTDLFLPEPPYLARLPQAAFIGAVAGGLTSVLAGLVLATAILALSRVYQPWWMSGLVGQTFIGAFCYAPIAALAGAGTGTCLVIRSRNADRTPGTIRSKAQT